MFILCEGDERPSEEQRADPIASEGLYFEFSEEQITPGESFDVCVEVLDRLLSCKTLTKSESNHPDEVTFSIN
jgi:hypothetical protein